MYDFQIEKIIKKGNEFYDKLKKDENCRYKSWKYCYKVFYDLHQSEDYSEEANLLKNEILNIIPDKYKENTKILDGLNINNRDKI